MTPSSSAPRPASALPTRLTTDDLRHKALAVRDVALDETRRVLDGGTARIVIAGAVIFAVAVSVAYLAGTRAARTRAGAR